MTRRRTPLLPNEEYCPKCEGDGMVPEFRECTSSVAEEPFLATGSHVECERCEGEGVSIEERRENFDAREAIQQIKAGHRAVIIDLLRDAEKLDGQRLARINEQHEQIERLKDEVRRLTARVTGVGVAYIRSQPAGGKGAA